MKQYVQESYNLYIDGQWVPSSDGKTFKEYNPSNGEFLAEVSEATDFDVLPERYASTIPGLWSPL